MFLAKTELILFINIAEWHILPVQWYSKEICCLNKE